MPRSLSALVNLNSRPQAMWRSGSSFEAGIFWSTEHVQFLYFTAGSNSFKNRHNAHVFWLLSSPALRTIAVTAGTGGIGDFVAGTVGDGVCDCGGCGGVWTRGSGSDAPPESSRFGPPEFSMLAWMCGRLWRCAFCVEVAG